jgi:hypothetical protein
LPDLTGLVQYRPSGFLRGRKRKTVFQFAY